jgi:hypothetical protein
MTASLYKIAPENIHVQLYIMTENIYIYDGEDLVSLLFVSDPLSIIG